MNFMKNLVVLLFAFISISAFSQTKLSTTSSHIKFFSSTPAEDIEANNYKAIGVIKPDKGSIVFSIPMQSFEFEKALMQKHFNTEKFLHTKAFPKSKFKGTITNITSIDFDKDGTYIADVTGFLTIRGVTKEISEKFNIVVKDGTVTGTTEFPIVLADYGIAFKEGKPSTNLAKTIKVTAKFNFTKISA
jgi:polyisoprenoid-binding protein YceI